MQSKQKVLVTCFVLAQAALLCAPANAQVPSDPYNYVRTSSFTYRADGLLASETVEPDNLASCVVTTYGYDGYGNKVSATTSNCAGTVPARQQFTQRATSSNFAPAGGQSVTVSGVPVSVPQGLFAITATNALSQSETREYDPRYGSVTKLTGPNQLITAVQVDDLGRTIKQTRADGTSTVSYYCDLRYLGAGGSINPSTPGCPTPGTSEAPADALMFVHSEPRDTGGVKMGPFTRVYTDKLGRKIRTVTEAFDGTSQPGGAGRLIVSDVQYNAYGAAVLSTQAYFLDSGSTTTTGASDVGMTLTTYDALGRPVDAYVTDPQGSVAGVDFAGRGTRKAAHTHFDYTALTTKITNDKGQTRTEEKNANGEVVRITDTLGAQLARQYDAFGNLVLTQDALQNLVRLTYDIRGRKTQMEDPDSGRWSYDYDALGQLVWQQSPNQRAASQQTTMVYDLLGRMIQRVEPEYTSTWTYDKYADGTACSKGIGKLCEASTGAAGFDRTFAYDKYGRPASTRTTITNGPSFASAVAYNNTNGRVTSQTYPTGLTVNYTYTTGSRGFLEKVTLGTAATVNPLPATPGGAAGPSVPLAAGTVLWQSLAVNAAGQVEQSKTSNNVTSTSAYDPATGRINALTAGIGSATTVLNDTYTWDSLGNLSQRTDANGDGSSGAVQETFVYDGLNRLVDDTVNAPAIAGYLRKSTLQYNALGNLLYKSDVGVYSYAASGNVNGVSNVRPHALASVSAASGTSYSYDANGNLISASAGSYRTLSYTSFNLPDSNTGIAGPSGTPTYRWNYDSEHQRIKETRTITGGTDAGTRVTWMMHPDNAGGLGFESETTTPTNGAATTMNRHYLNAGGVSIGVLVSSGALPTLSAGVTTPPTLSSITLVKVEYWHKDHLGSIVATTDHTGAVTARYAFDAFGKRRYANGVYDQAGTLIIDNTTNTNNGTDRGYTGHEQLDDIGLIHMNGRLFDPLTGRFLQTDPFVQDPSSLQNFNRYGYGLNNALGGTDPTGYSWLSKTWHKIWHNKIVRTAIIVAASYYAGQWAIEQYATGEAATSGYAAAAANAEAAAAAAGAEPSLIAAAGQMAMEEGYITATNSILAGVIGGAAGGFTGSFVASNGNVRVGLNGAFNGALTGGINNYYGSQYPIDRVVANGIAGGMGAVLRGDSFAHGFRSSAEISSLVYLNSLMRQAMIAQSRLDPRNDGAGLSSGMFKDGYKLAGGRWFFGTKDGCSWLGCWQNGPGSVFGMHYDSGDLRDMILESFAGPHDMANSHWFYINTADQVNSALEEVVGDAFSADHYSGFESGFLEITTNYTTSLMFASPFAAGAILEQSWMSANLDAMRRR